MDKIIKKINKTKYIWYYPKSKSKIIPIEKGDNLKLTKTNLLKKLNKNNELDNLDLVLITLNYNKNTSKLIPTNVNIYVSFYKYKNNKITNTFNKDLPSGMIFFKHPIKHLKSKNYPKIIKKLYFDKLKIKPLDIIYFTDL